MLKILNAVKNLRKSRYLLVVLGLAVIAGLIYFYRGSIIAAMVNGEAITRAKLTGELDTRYGKDTLESLIEQTLISQEAKKEKVNISQADINNQIKSIEDSLKSQNMTLDEALATRGLTKEDLIEQIKIQKTVETILGKNISISDSDIENYFTQNKTMFAKDAKLADVKDQIKEQLLQQKLGTEYQKWIADLKSKARINYFVKF